MKLITHSLNQWCGRLILLVISVLIVLGLGEGFVRLFLNMEPEPILFERESAVPGLVWENIPHFQGSYGGVPVKINSQGFRDYDRYSQEKPEGVNRLLILGDSIVFGHGVPMRDTFAKKLEDKFNRDEVGEYEVINTGVPGYNTFQEMVFFREIGLKYSPDVLVLAFCLNDPLAPIGNDNPQPSSSNTPTQAVDGQQVLQEGTSAAKEEEGMPTTQLETPGSIPIPYNLKVFLDKHSELYKFVHKRYHILLQQLGIRPPIFSLLYTDPNGVGWRITKESLKTIADLSHARDIKIVLMIFPVLFRLNDKYPFSQSHDLIRSEAQKYGFHIIDMLDIYRQYETESLTLGNGDGIHPNTFGHEVAAEALYQSLISLTW